MTGYDTTPRPDSILVGTPSGEAVQVPTTFETATADHVVGPVPDEWVVDRVFIDTGQLHAESFVEPDGDRGRYVEAVWYPETRPQPDRAQPRGWGVHVTRGERPPASYPATGMGTTLWCRCEGDV